MQPETDQVELRRNIQLGHPPSIHPKEGYHAIV